MYFFSKTFGQFKKNTYLCIRFQKQTTNYGKESTYQKGKGHCQKEQ